MDLKQYMHKNKITAEQLAKELDTHHQTIFRVMAGKSPSLYIAYKIVHYTRGLVSYEDLVRGRLNDSDL